MDVYSRASTEEMLKMARQEQVYDKEHFLAVQAARDRAEFERVLRYVPLGHSNDLSCSCVIQFEA